MNRLCNCKEAEMKPKTKKLIKSFKQSLRGKAVSKWGFLSSHIPMRTQFRWFLSRIRSELGREAAKVVKELP